MNFCPGSEAVGAKEFLPRKRKRQVQNKYSALKEKHRVQQFHYNNVKRNKNEAVHFVQSFFQSNGGKRW